MPKWALQFDDASRRDYLLGFQRRRKERQAKAKEQVSKAEVRRRASERRARREEARQMYNTRCLFPITPDFRQSFPEEVEGGGDEDENDEEAEEKAVHDVSVIAPPSKSTEVGTRPGEAEGEVGGRAKRKGSGDRAPKGRQRDTAKRGRGRGRGRGGRGPRGAKRRKT